MPGSMTRTAERDIRFVESWGTETPEPQAGTIDGLDSADQRILSAWLDGAAAAGIDTVLDLGVRPWNIAGANVICGVFETNRDQASWLIIRYGPGWTLARCSDGFISDVFASLPDILRIIDADMRR